MFRYSVLFLEKLFLKDWRSPCLESVPAVVQPQIQPLQVCHKSATSALGSAAAMHPWMDGGVKLCADRGLPTPWHVRLGLYCRHQPKQSVARPGWAEGHNSQVTHGSYQLLLGTYQGARPAPAYCHVGSQENPAPPFAPLMAWLLWWMMMFF